MLILILLIDVVLLHLLRGDRILKDILYSFSLLSAINEIMPIMVWIFVFLEIHMWKY